MGLREEWLRHICRNTCLPTDPGARRQFLRQLVWSTTAIGLAGSTALRAQVAPRVRFVADPFALGVASGYPHPTGFTLWTRLAPAPLLPDGGMTEERVTLRCEIAHDEGFTRIEQSLEVFASPEAAHSVHVDIDGLESDRAYHYRFVVGDAVSQVARARTLPAAGSALSHFRIAFASCQNYEHGYFSAYRQMLKDAPDLVLFLGDYIYENQWGDNPIRRHIGGEANTLAGYRVRHAQYKLDADLQRMHRAGAWVFTWDDHEVDNDYANDTSENLDPQFLLRRSAAYQAYFEHLPLPRRMRPSGNEMRTYTHFDVGDLLRIYLLDDRQYRTPQPCPPQNRHGSRTLDRCDDLAQPSQTMLGSMQEDWLSGAFQQSSARWNLIGQQTILTPVDESPGPDRGVWTDGWDGYPLARQKLMDAMLDAQLRNPVIAGGDLHCAVVAKLPRETADLESPSIASEFVTTSLSADGWPQSHYERNRAENPHIKHRRSDQRGFCLLDFKSEAMDAKLQVVSDVRVKEPSFATQARYRVENGRPEPQVS